MDNEIFAQEKLAMMTAHFDCLTITIFRHCVAAKQLKNTQNRAHLNLLCKIYALDSLTKNTSILYSAGFLGQGCHAYFFPAMDTLAQELRPQMIPLVEALGFPDELICSAIGNSYGDIYETQLEWAKNSKYNKEDVPPMFETMIKPFMMGKL